MDAHAYSLKQKHGEWIVCGDDKELLVCANKEAALKLILAAAEAAGQTADVWHTSSAQHADQKS